MTMSKLNPQCRRYPPKSFHIIVHGMQQKSQPSQSTQGFCTGPGFMIELTELLDEGSIVSID